MREKRIDVISRTVEPYKDFESYLKLAESDDFRFVVSNTTEAGICFNKDDKPENDIVAITNLTACGVHLMLFTTGRGTPLGAPVPTVKISTNRTLFEKIQLD